MTGKSASIHNALNILGIVFFLVFTEWRETLKQRNGYTEMSCLLERYLYHFFATMLRLAKIER